MTQGLEQGGFEGSLVAAKLSRYKKVNMNHTGSLTLAWPQCRAGNDEKERERERDRERERG